MTYCATRSADGTIGSCSRTRPAAIKEIYVGPVADMSIAEQLNRFTTIKMAFKERGVLVRSPIAAGLSTRVRLAE